MTPIDTLIIMNCSKTKRSIDEKRIVKGSVAEELSKRHSFADLLDETSRKKLKTLQKKVHDQLMTTSRENSGNESSDTNLEEGKSLPAFLRYAGRVFQNVKLESWINALKTPQLDVWILTAYRGIVTYTEPLPNYDLTIHDKLFSGMTMRRWWKDHALPEIIWNAIERNKPQRIIILASKNYQSLLPMKKLLASRPSFKIDIPSFPGGMGSLYHKGKWLDDVLATISQARHQS